MTDRPQMDPKFERPEEEKKPTPVTPSLVVSSAVFAKLQTKVDKNEARLTKLENLHAKSSRKTKIEIQYHSDLIAGMERKI